MRFYGRNYDFDMPLDYGVFSEKDWPENELVHFYYYLSSDINSYQIFSYQGINAISLIKDVVPKLELTEETELRDLSSDK